MSLYALTIFCGAFLLFLVQPLIGKYILPWFGGGPGIWTTCLLFFQTLLLAGYAYAHFLSRLAVRRQAVVHLVLLVVSLAFLPVIPGERWAPADTANPIARILLLLTATLGLPYLALSPTGPLIQHWFSVAHPDKSPYRLYALSNTGSLLALVAYPFVFEPLFSRSAVSLGWSGGLALFVLLCGLCARRLWRAAPVILPATGQGPTAAAATAAEVENAPTPIDRFLWLALPGVASVLLVATTNKLCLDVAAVPFLWVLPLGVYLLTFILCFDHPRWYRRGPFAALLALGACVLAFFFSIEAPPLSQQVIALTTMLFVGGMVCHGELHRLRPPPRQLTGYYLSIAAGGAGGSLFVTLGAPLLFSDYHELQLGLVLLIYLVGVISYFRRSLVLVLGLAAGLVLVPFVVPVLRADPGPAWYGWFASLGREWIRFVQSHGELMLAFGLLLAVALRDGWRLAPAWRRRTAVVPVLLTLLLVLLFVRQAAEKNEHVHVAERNFYGAFKVFLDDHAKDPNAHFLLLANGGITHGLQFRGGGFSRWATTYYSETSGLGRALAVLPSPRRVGAVGLGAGTLAVYGRPGDHFRFYEINPAIVRVAGRPFSNLAASEAETSVALGDARLVMQAELRDGTAGRFDLIVLDAFSGDAIPVHLLTAEALEIYLGRLRPGGLIAVHISNRHLDLRAVVEGLAKHRGLHAATISDTVDPQSWWLYNTVWVLLSSDPAILARDPIAAAAQEPPDADARTILWTDDHASLFEVMH